MSKHTPGPWEIERRRSFVTAIGPCVADEYAGSAWLDVSEADARLIAAAPELLEALQNLTGILKDAGYATSHADAAIAKATQE